MTLKDKQINDDGAMDPGIRNFLEKRCRTGELSCAEAFHLADRLGISPADVGWYADQLRLRLTKCQMGLFGHGPGKKVVKPAAEVDEALKDMLMAVLVNDRLSCVAAWDIAAQAGIAKMAVSAACETLGIKIKPCQLGAF